MSTEQQRDTAWARMVDEGRMKPTELVERILFDVIPEKCDEDIDIIDLARRIVSALQY